MSSSSLPLELHEVLEQEYLSMYGPLKRPENDAIELLDVQWARRILQECGLTVEQSDDPVAARLKKFVDDGKELDQLRHSPALTDRGRYLLDHGDRADTEVRRRIVDEAFAGAVKALRDVRLENVYAAIHARRDEGKPRTALCISGGGIRSATFALGVIQGLSAANILDKFDYLSTVSGGGYIGGWLSSWVRRHRRGVTGVQETLQNADLSIGEATEDTLVRAEKTPPRDARQLPERKVYPEPEPLRHLRAFSNYLSPSLSLFSGDTWSIASLYARNLLLNLLVLVPLLAMALAVPRIYSWVLEAQFLQPAAWAWIAAGLVTYAFAYIGIKRPVEQGRKARLTATNDAAFIANCILPLTGAALSLAVFYARSDQFNKSVLDGSGAGILAVAGMTVVPYLLYYGRVWTSNAAERRASFTKGTQLYLKKQAIEGFAVIVAVATTFALLYLLTQKVFDDPIRDAGEAAANAMSPQAQLYLCFSVPLILLVFFVQASVFVGLSGRQNEDYDREWWGRAGAWLLAFAVVLAVFNLIAVFGPIALYYSPIILGAIGGAAGIGAALFGFSDKSSAKKQESGGMAAMASGIGSALAVPLFIAALLAAISLATTWLIQELQTDVEPVVAATITADQLAKLRSTEHLQVIQGTTPMQVLIFIGTGLFAAVLSLFIGANKFSMAALYRNRIIRAYLGASRYTRDPDAFTGFDENDNMQLWEMRPELLWPSQFRDLPKLVEAMTANDGIPRKLFDLLEKPTQKALKKKTLDGSAIDVLTQNLNDLLMHSETFADDLGVKEPKWVKTDAGQFGYPLSIRNRATLDAQFAEYIDVMAPPADAKNAPKSKGARAPLHVINTALNLTSGENLAWQQRMACSFPMSPLHCGNLGLGFRDARRYGGYDDGVSLGTAVTISGAAASPNMGYHSSATMAFLMTFFNIRLGAWLGNPGWRGEKTYDKKHPTSGLIPLASELTGNSNAKSGWIYLSDGGHFENLGLYEMVVRRCHEIVLSDGGADPKCTFEDFGNAIRKIRIDLGIPIEVESITAMHPRSANGEPVDGEYVLTARIRYDAVDAKATPGRITYIKPGIYKGDYFPIDVYNYAMDTVAFPHEPTGDQFFSESQFESYRALGRHAIDAIYSSRVSAAGARLPIRKQPSVEHFNDLVAQPRPTMTPHVQTSA